MSYILERFGDIKLIETGISDDISSAETVPTIQVLPGGHAFDLYGDDVAPRLSRTIKKSGILIDEHERRYLEHMALRGKVGWLWRKRIKSGETERIRARVRKVSSTFEAHWELGQYVDIEFETLPIPWLGRKHLGIWRWDAGIMLDDAYFLDEPRNSFVISESPFFIKNNGNAQTHLKIIINVNFSLFFLRLTLSQESINAKLEWHGNLMTGDTLVIDSLNQSITVNGSDNFANLEFAAEHIYPDFLPLLSGTNRLTINYTGNNNTQITLEHSDAFE